MKKVEIITCIFHVRGRWMVPFWPFVTLFVLKLTFVLVCCIIWLMRSSCWRESPSLLLPAAGKLGDDDLDSSRLVFPFPLNWIQFEPCGELASPNLHHFICIWVKMVEIVENIILRKWMAWACPMEWKCEKWKENPKL